MDIKIDKNVPVPDRTGNTGSKFAHAVRALQVGDSFWLPKDSVGKGFPGAVRNLSLAIGIKTALRTVEQDGVASWRVWRIEKPDENGDNAK